MNIEIDPNSGFCFGVTNAIKMAENILENKETLYCLGDIVHNNEEVDRLRKLGLISINHKKLKELNNTTVLIRAHGEPPSTYETAKQNNIKLIDSTCPVVLRLQKRIKKESKEIIEKDDQIVIFGKHGHAEVVGLIGQTQGNAVVLMDNNDLEKVDYSKRIHLFSQTTRKVIDYKNIAEKIKENKKNAGYNPEDIIIQNTICPSVSGREPGLKEFAKKHDIIIFVSGEKSSNGKMLYQVCKQSNEYSYFVSKPQDINIKWFKNAESVGISGATSTPSWLMEEVAETINKLENGKL